MILPDHDFFFNNIYVCLGGRGASSWNPAYLRRFAEYFLDRRLRASVSAFLGSVRLNYMCVTSLVFVTIRGAAD